jgi:protein-S-isoprenylcysteine O-methyltransferase Ste14
VDTDSSEKTGGFTAETQRTRRDEIFLAGTRIIYGFDRGLARRCVGGGVRTGMSFAASEAEFRGRFWTIWASYWIGFLFYAVDPVNVCFAVMAHFAGITDGARLTHLVKLCFGLATVLVAIAAAIRTWAEAYLHSSIVHDASLHGEQLVADGPFRRLRNPLYLGNIFLSLGVGLLASRIGFFVIVLGNFLIVYRLILREEATLLASQGESYRRFYGAVPRLIPSLVPSVPASGARPNWKDAFSGEMFMWAAAVATGTYAFTLNLAYFWGVFGIGLVVYFLQSWARQRAKKSAA